MNGETCADLADFPLENYGAVGANLHGTPVVCGGCSSGCITKHVTNTPMMDGKQFASMKEKRGYAAGVTSQEQVPLFLEVVMAQDQRQLSSLA